MKVGPMKAGRPREFELDTALDRAVALFWTNGYEGTSITDLTEALGITRASLYAAFGGKEALFRQVMERYESRAGAYRVAAGKAPSLDEAVRLLLTGPVELHGDRGNPRGCLGVQGALAAGAGASSVRDDLSRRRRKGEAAIRKRLQRARDQGELREGSDPGALALYLSALIYGMAVLAAGGAGRRELRGVSDTALRHWRAAEAGEG